MIELLPKDFKLEEHHYSIRTQRLRAARKNGTHTKTEWLEMKEFFKNTCVRCLGESGLIRVVKDHIKPLYQQNSSDGLDNLQPLCALCNCSKGAENIDWRPQAADFFELELPEKYKQKSNG